MSGYLYDHTPVSILGGGLPGGQPPGGLLGGGGGTYGGTGMEGGSTRGRDRDVLRRGFGRFKPRTIVDNNSNNGTTRQVNVIVEPNKNGSGNVYVLDGVQKPELHVQSGDVIKFMLHPALLVAHPLHFSTEVIHSNQLANPYTNNVVQKVDCVELHITNNTPSTLHYFCGIHDGMGNQITKISQVQKTNPRIITPFRQAYNAGDIAGTVDQRTQEAAPNQVNGIAPVNSLRKYERSRGAASGGGSKFTGNPRYVYDSSDYIRFRKLAAKNKNYNDKSFGGDESHASYVPRMRNF